MKWLKVVWEWLNAPRPYLLVELTPPAEDGALDMQPSIDVLATSLQGLPVTSREDQP